MGKLFFLGFLFLSTVLYCQQPPSASYLLRTGYVQPHIKPENYTPHQLDEVTVAFYKQWKTVHIRRDCADPFQFYVFDNEKTNREHGIICVSEGQAYGMIIAVTMAGFDPEAKNIFDGLFRFYKAHPSLVSPYLMTWEIASGCVTKSAHDNNYSASDADMDIAFSLLLADKQWGSGGVINYRKEALLMLDAIRKHELNIVRHTVLLSDALEDDDPKYADTRTSDFMPGHFREFFQATHDSIWLKVLDKEYKILEHIQRKYSPKAGLLPDFIQFSKGEYIPAKAHYLESGHDGHYYYNACRIPWRLACDFLISGDRRAYSMVCKMNRTMERKAKGDPDNLYSGFTLDGDDIHGNDYATPAFLAPLAVGAMVDPSSQKWLTDLWNYMLKLQFNDYQYYDNTLQLLCMIVISGNYQIPSTTTNLIK